MKKTILSLVWLLCSPLISGEQSGGGFTIISIDQLECGDELVVSHSEYAELKSMALENQGVAYLDGNEVILSFSGETIIISVVGLDCEVAVVASDEIVML